MNLMEKMGILTGAAKYDVACTSSGASRKGAAGKLGNAVRGGICHSFAADGRCISLLKILMSNNCVFDCKYCANRTSNDVPRATLDPDELASLTIAFYRRNYIEGLFLSSGVLVNPDYTMERMIRALEILRNDYRFNGYIHAKAIPGASEPLITKLGIVADRLSVNIELPSEKSLNILAPNKDRNSLIQPMNFITNRIAQSKNELALFKNAPNFAQAGHATQMVIGATPDTDFQIVRLAESLYKKFRLRRVFYSAYVAMGSHELLPVGQPPPLLREHRLYQSDWLLRFYGFKASEILDNEHQTLSLEVDPKCNWALNHMDWFPVEVNKADYELLLRVPGIGQISAKRIIAARRTTILSFADLKKLGVTLKRAVYFITCSGKTMHGLALNEKAIFRNLTAGSRREAFRVREGGAPYQFSFLEDSSSDGLYLTDSAGAFDDAGAAGRLLSGGSPAARLLPGGTDEAAAPGGFGGAVWPVQGGMGTAGGFGAALPIQDGLGYIGALSANDGMYLPGGFGMTGADTNYMPGAGPAHNGNLPPSASDIDTSLIPAPEDIRMSITGQM